MPIDKILLAPKDRNIRASNGEIVTPGYWYVIHPMPPYYGIVEIGPYSATVYHKSEIDPRSLAFFAPVPMPSLTPPQFMDAVRHEERYRSWLAEPPHRLVFDEVKQEWMISLKMSGPLDRADLDKAVGKEKADQMMAVPGRRQLTEDECDPDDYYRALIVFDNRHDADEFAVEVTEALRQQDLI